MRATGCTSVAVCPPMTASAPRARPMRHVHSTLRPRGLPPSSSAVVRRSVAFPTVRCEASSSGTDIVERKTTTQKMFDRMNAEKILANEQAGGAGGSTTYAALQGADKVWYNLRNMKTGVEAGEAPQFVTTQPGICPTGIDYDVIICGGTLGIVLAVALQLRGLKTAIVERGPLRGRAQEWNISRKEMAELVEQGLLTAQEVEDVISVEFNPVRVQFAGSDPVWTTDILNLGVRPDKIVDILRARYEATGGVVYEQTNLNGVESYDNGVALKVGDSEEGTDVVLTSKLMLDCMGHFSPVVRQLRWGTKPDGVCLVVGSCCRGFSENSTGDVIYTNSPIQPEGAEVTNLQYFWEAFPAGTGPNDRTTYMFTYIDADPARPDLEALFEDYWSRMPEYQGVDIDDLAPLRMLFGFFPTYRASPLQPGFDRVLQVGDASGIQSPLSFGGFGAMTRHLVRLSSAVGEAVEADCLDQGSLGLIATYNPGLSGAWMLQRAMSVRPGENPDPEFINKLLGTNFAAMEKLGDEVMLPFLQDVIQFPALARTMLGQVSEDPLFVPQIMSHVGLEPLLDWTQHFIGLGMYDAAYRLLSPFKDNFQSLPAKPRFAFNRLLEALEYGSGNDYVLSSRSGSTEIMTSSKA